MFRVKYIYVSAYSFTYAHDTYLISSKHPMYEIVICYELDFNYTKWIANFWFPPKTIYLGMFYDRINCNIWLNLGLMSIRSLNAMISSCIATTSHLWIVTRQDNSFCVPCDHGVGIRHEWLSHKNQGGEPSNWFDSYLWTIRLYQ